MYLKRKAIHSNSLYCCIRSAHSVYRGNAPYVFRFFCIFLCIGVLSITSCSSTARVIFTDDALAMDNVHTDIDLIIEFSPYFTEYTKDLLGYTVFSDIIVIDDAKQYMLDQDGVTNVHIGIHNDPVRLLIRLATDDLSATLNSLGVKNSKQKTAVGMNYLSLSINSQFFLRLLQRFPRLKDVPLEAFVTPKSEIPKAQWPQYISWSLEDYASRDDIEADLVQSDITLIVERPRLQLPDIGWLGYPGDAKKQQKVISLIDFLYGDEEEIILTY